MQELLIESIRTDGTQSRVNIDRAYVAELVEMVKAGRKLPPVDVFRADGETWMADGFHRLLAHQECGKRTIRAEIHKGTKSDALWHAAGANVAHGLRRSNADKRRAVEMALEQRPTASNELIADHCGVSHTLVSGIRLQVQVATVATYPRIGKDGKKYPPPPPPPPPQRVAKVIEQNDAPVEPPKRREESRTSMSIKDARGTDVPDHLHRLFQRGDDIKVLLSMLSKIRGAVRDGADDPLWQECNRNSVEAALGQAYADIKATIPYAVCPWCHGKAPMQDGCKACGTRGALGEHRWNTIVPREMK